MQSANDWIIPIALFGAIVGSFLNVVIFRLPRGLSIGKPSWSFCPHCGKQIRPIHNIPVIGWLALRGRCRDCRAPIGLVYPVIECATALLFVMVWDALFLAGAVPGMEAALPARDWPMAIAYLTLFAGLLATAAMDIESYTIDIRVSILTMGVGVACHAIRGLPSVLDTADIATTATPATAMPTGLLPAALCVIGVAVGVTWWLTARIGSHLLARQSDGSAQDVESEATAGIDPPDEPPTFYRSGETTRFRPGIVVIFSALIVFLIGWQMAAPEPAHSANDALAAGWPRGLLACSVFMLLLLSASLVHREADDQIIQDIESERQGARSMVLRELAWFLPALLAGIGLFAYARASGKVTMDLSQWPGLPDADSSWLPHLQGACQAAAAMTFAAALGWSVRIAGTLAFGKEAFGTGDIYIMAAIGAVCGFWAALFAFFLAALLALVGVLVTLFRKTSRAVPFGPWLALGACVALWVAGPLLGYFRPVGRMLWSILSGLPVWQLDG